MKYNTDAMRAHEADEDYFTRNPHAVWRVRGRGSQPRAPRDTRCHFDRQCAQWLGRQTARPAR